MVIACRFFATADAGVRARQPSGKYDDQMGAAHPGSFPGSHRNYKRWSAPVP